MILALIGINEAPNLQEDLVFVYFSVLILAVDNVDDAVELAQLLFLLIDFSTQRLHNL